MDEDKIKKVKEITEELLQKMTLSDFSVTVKLFTETTQGPALDSSLEGQSVIDLEIELKEPQILIGSNGQTLFELQHILRIILNKKLSQLQGDFKLLPKSIGSFFYLKLDINNYKKKKIEYLKNLAKDMADEVSLTKEKKILSPMPSYQRRIIHTELAQRRDVITESQGDGESRYIVIKPVT